MKTIDIDEMKNLQAEILSDVAAYCEREGIRYYLCGGTLLGSVRHRGFIPWDDDIDVCMPRPDYIRFIRSYRNDRYSVLSWENDHRFLCTYAKVSDNRTRFIENVDFGIDIGVNIDVFPVDGLPSGEKKINRTVTRMKFLWGLVVCASLKDASKRKPAKRFAIRCAKMFFRVFHAESKITGHVVRQAQRYPFDTSDKVAVLVWGYGKKEVVSKSVATEYTESAFENSIYNIPKNYEEYLCSIYGDYMKLPPEEDRVYKHKAEVYWL